jgi:polysaccharide deacetylase family protein (PEP-CTERM system associated)
LDPTIPGMRALTSKNVVSVDVEDYFHAEIFSRVVQSSEWDRYPTRVVSNTRRLLELFSTCNVQATFFVVGWVAERFPDLVREIAALGHELACHSYWHRLIYRLTPNDFREDTYRAKSVIEQVAGQSIRGYRAPTYSIVEASLWALEILVELGFDYDSSIYPIHHDRYGMPGAPRAPFRIRTASGSLTEYPLTTFRIAGHRFPVGGGGYLRLLPTWYTSMGIKRAHKDGLPIITYIHPWEIDPEQPRLPIKLLSRLRHYVNLSRSFDRLADMLNTGAFSSFRESHLADQAEEIDLHALRNQD